MHIQKEKRALSKKGKKGIIFIDDWHMAKL
jgi:hypothetical protein